MMKEKPIVLYTDHVINKSLCYYFAKGSQSLMCHVDNFKEFDKPIATYGIKRGTADILKKVSEFYYIDHGYFNQSKRSFKNSKTTIFNLDGYFRIVHNDFFHNGKGNNGSDRLDRLKLNFKKKRISGEYIILSPPGESSSFFNLKNWVEKTTRDIKKYSDRKIIVHKRGSDVPLDELLEKAWAFVTSHSSAAFKAMINGVPSYFTNQTLSQIASIDQIEKNEINYSAFKNLAYCQWNIKEIESGEAWEYISKGSK